MTQIDLVQSIPCGKGNTCMIVDHIEPGEAASVHILELAWDWLGEEDMGADVQDRMMHVIHVAGIYVLSLRFLMPLAVQCGSFILQGVHCRPQYKAIMLSIYQFCGQTYHRQSCQLIPARTAYLSTPDRAHRKCKRTGCTPLPSTRIDTPWLTSIRSYWFNFPYHRRWRASTTTMNN